MEKYNAVFVEQKWQKIWEEKKIYYTNFDDKKRKKYYNLVMFPYPSGDKLHIGHWYNFAPADSYARYMRMAGYNIFEPMGYDAFGLPAENYAIKTGVHPRTSTDKNIAYMRKQLKEMGAMYDWSREINTSESEYYRWTQWMFLKMYERGLAYRKKAPANWCPSCKTVLANEQVQDGLCERCDSQVTKKDLTQWFFKIRDYAEKLLDFDSLNWPEKTKLMQEYWIGKSIGIDIWYDIEGLNDKITVYTTRPDTNFGATFIVVAPESEFVEKHFDKFENKKEISAYVEEAKKRTDIERIAEGRKKTGVFTGLQAVNHLTSKKMPIYVSDFVLAHVGTGCVVGVPGHDIRDFEFAKEKGLEIIRVVVGPDGDDSPIAKPEQVQEENGTMVNSDFLNGMNIHVATEAIKDHIEKKGWGKRVTNYKLRDWLISRQRYWGAPIPMIFCEKCGEVPVSEKDLPVELPNLVDFKPTGDGKSPLSTVKEFVNVKCPKCKGKAERETDTMDTFVDSSWYFLRYVDTQNSKKPFDEKNVKHWLPVDMYIGGPEHACMHLLYARFFTKVLYDAGYVHFDEPFIRLVHQGLITKDGAKMSKSKGNVVAPDGFIRKYGSDVFRLYLMFMGPFTDGGDWNDKGINGIARFADRLFKMFNSEHAKVDALEFNQILQATIKKVQEDIEALHFNTAIAILMELLNAVSKHGIGLESKKIFAKLLAPLAPHLAEEAWEILGGKFSIFDEEWPKYDKKALEKKTITLVIQVNGKVRATISCETNISKEEAVKLALKDPNVEKYVAGKKIIKEIFVPGKLLSFAVIEN